jgi:hypothetical protein
MADTGYRAPAGFTTMAQAAERLAVSMVTLRKTIRDEGIEVFEDPKNKRVRLLRVEDVERLEQPRPVRSLEGKEAA